MFNKVAIFFAIKISLLAITTLLWTLFAKPVARHGPPTAEIFTSFIPLSKSSLSNLSINKGDLSGNFVEFIRVYFNLNHTIVRDIGMELISPQVTRVNILQPFTNVGTNPANYVVEIGVSAFYGEEVEGDWTLRVTEYTNDGTQGLLNYWGMKVYGH